MTNLDLNQNGSIRGRRLRIAQLAPPVEAVPPPKYGGTERVVSLLTEELVRRGHSVTLFASGDSRTSAELVPIVDRAIWRHPSFEDAWPFVSMALDLVYSRAKQFDIIHNHLGFIAFPVARAHPWTPTLTTLHGRLDLPELEMVHSHFRDAPVVSISDAQRVPIPWANWLATIYHGVEPDELPFRPAHRGYLAFLGRICPEKGLDTAIAVARRVGVPLKVAARMPLKLAGDPESRRDREYYDQVIAPLLEGPGVEYLGELTGREKAEFLADAAALLFPVRWPEPFGLAMAEALAQGTPVLALRNGSVPEIVEDGVTGFVADDEDGLARAVGRLDELDRARCRAVAQARFSPAAMTDAYERAYGRLLARDASPPSREGRLVGAHPPRRTVARSSRKVS